MNDTIGIDVSKDSLDAYWLSGHQHKQFSNDTVGLKLLVSWAQSTKVSLVVFEATGIYHRLLEAALAARSLAFARVNPRQARRFCEVAGQLAKTVRVDAAMLGLCWRWRPVNPRAKPCMTSNNWRQPARRY